MPFQHGRPAPLHMASFNKSGHHHPSFVPTDIDTRGEGRRPLRTKRRRTSATIARAFLGCGIMKMIYDISKYSGHIRRQH